MKVIILKNKLYPQIKFQVLKSSGSNSNKANIRYNGYMISLFKWRVGIYISKKIKTLNFKGISNIRMIWSIPNDLDNNISDSQKSEC